MTINRSQVTVPDVIAKLAEHNRLFPYAGKHSLLEQQFKQRYVDILQETLGMNGSSQPIRKSGTKLATIDRIVFMDTAPPRGLAVGGKVEGAALEPPVHPVAMDGSYMNWRIESLVLLSAQAVRSSYPKLLQSNEMRSTGQ